MPLVSVVIPAYNAASDLPETIESVLRQSFTDFELLIINDGSIDATQEVVQAYAQKDSRIRLISQVNQGVAIARNHGIQESMGAYIAFLDSDDLWTSGKLAAHVDHLNAVPQVGLSFARIEFMQADGRLTGQHSNLRLKQIQPQHLYKDNLVCTPSNAVIRREVLEQVGGFTQGLSGMADAELFLRICCHGWQVEGLNQILVYYRTSTTGMSAHLQKMEAEWYQFSHQVNQYAPDLVDQYFNAAKAVFLRYLARRSLRLNLQPMVGVEFIKRAIQSDWKIILKEPRRTLLTTAAIYGQYFLQGRKLQGLSDYS